MQRKRQSEFKVESQSEDEDVSENEIDENASKNEPEHESVSENDEEDNQSGDMDVAGPSGLNDANEVKQPKKRKRGIIYISSIPKHMTVMILREMLNQYAKIDRVFLQPGKLPGKTSIPQLEILTILIVLKSFSDENKNRKKKRRRLARHFTEGWVEFVSKRAAKQVAAKLNNSPIATRKSSKFYDIRWSMKYLPRFKWVHLSERLTYEKAVYRQKLQTEIGQARKEAAFFQENLDKSDKFKKMNKRANKTKKESVKIDE